MQSTGEVIGLHADPRVALAKAMQGADGRKGRNALNQERSRLQERSTYNNLKGRAAQASRMWDHSDEGAVLVAERHTHDQRGPSLTR